MMLLAVLLCVQISAGDAADQPVQSQNQPGKPALKSLVKTELFADVSAVEAGKPFTVGVLFKIAPGWHIYWKEPGDAGLSTLIDFKAPAGFTVGELQYPQHLTFNQPGDIVGYGYKDEVMLFATVTPPAELKSDAPVTITAESSWLCCENICVPGEAKQEIQLPIGSAAPNQETLFATWRERTPPATQPSKEKS